MVPYLQQVKKERMPVNYYSVYLPGKFMNVRRENLWNAIRRAGFQRARYDETRTKYFVGDLPHDVLEVKLPRGIPQDEHKKAFRRLNRELRMVA
ncbi:MAG TPA: hypothetical protein VI874_02005 [Candidatus Norongarragalinales archaeon]|nr:hypothetical protein [Candidatus Norongarragalinales archaeon]